jgi:hypothetical protein
MCKAAFTLSLLSLIAVAAVSPTDAQTRNNRTTTTFSQPIEVPGRILPAGRYVFQLADSLSDRHIVQISNADGSELITTVLAINNYGLTATDKTVVTFNEVSRGALPLIILFALGSLLTGFGMIVFRKPVLAPVAR